MDCIRDVSWHPKVPLIAATSFGGNISVFTQDHSIPFKTRNVRKKCKEISGYYGAHREWSSEDEDDEAGSSPLNSSEPY